ncbi:hypothetical protein A5784_35175 [Mycobacterium sp. 852013-50091_SCH5140682]|uniref:hypothetical protein n=1 Tax=Mycobacterium sp. 852013-50091_SCH5140682 TaxID=1834109 RepID=UPI0007EAF706|nr:hypothetical protein [Mycobacterium sp. 852013-50091_SCH5140682]OBC11441.1 hypothetical protein A5784_35175 [Mycobacterium sp. 852013-50091_SCH5140682]
MAKLFHQKPSDIAILDERVGEFGTFFFNRGIAAFGRGVLSRLDEVSQSKNPVIARTQRMREWERLMGGDMDQSTTGFADPTEGSASAHARVVGERDGDEDIVL